MLTGYTHRVRIPVNHSPDGALTNFQVYITLYKGVGTSSAGNIYLQNASLDWPFDIRFTTSDGETLIDFWRKSFDDISGVWIVEIPNIGASGTTDIYLYYGHDNDTDASNGTNTFLAYADFAGGALPSTLTINGSPTVSYALTAIESYEIKIGDNASYYESNPEIVKFANGDLLAMWELRDANTHSGGTYFKTLGKRSTDGGKTWGSLETIYDTTAGGYSSVILGPNVLTINGTETLCAPLYTNKGGSWFLQYVYSTDKGANWSTPVTVSNQNRAVQGRIIKLSNGVLMIPSFLYSITSIFVERSTDNGATWTEVLIVNDSTHAPNEMGIIEIKTSGSYTGGVYALARTELGTHAYYRYWSTDYGATWGSGAQETGLPVPALQNPVSLWRLSDDSIIATFCSTPKRRIVAYKSTDECATWSGPILFVPGKYYLDTSAYSRPIEIADGVLGLIWITNSTNYSDAWFARFRWPATEYSCILNVDASTEFIQSNASTTPPAIMEWFIGDQALESAMYSLPMAWGNISDDCVIKALFGGNGRIALYAYDEGVSSYGSYYDIAKSWVNWKMVWYSGNAKLYADNNLVSQVTTHVPTESLPVSIGGTTYTYNSVGCLVWYFIRKYTANEPTWATPDTADLLVRAICQVI